MHGLSRVLGLFSALCCLAACSPEPKALLVEAGELSATSQRIRVARGDEAVTDARVTVNGALAAHTEGGTYVVPQPAPVTPGARFDVTVVTGEDTVEGQVVVPAAPLVRAPTAGSVHASTADLEVAWDFDGAAEGFVVALSSGTYAKQYEVASTARSLVVPSTDLPADAQLSISVLAVGRGVLAGPVAAGSVLTVHSGAAEAVSARRSLPLHVMGSDMGGTYQNVWVTTVRDEAVRDAHVTVNGQVVPYRTDISVYHGQLASPVGVGGELHLEVSLGGALYCSATGRVPEAPVLTAPAQSTTYTATAAIPVTWTSDTNPDRFQVNASWSCGTNCGTGKRFEATGTARALDIPAGQLPTNTDITLSVFSYNDGSYQGLCSATSRMNIRGNAFIERTIRITAP